MKLMILGGLAGVYCASWLASALLRGQLRDNLFRSIRKEDEGYRAMLIAYGVGLTISLTVLFMGFQSLDE